MKGCIIQRYRQKCGRGCIPVVFLYRSCLLLFFSLYESIQETEEEVLSLEEVSLDDETESWRLVLRKGDSVGLIDYFRTKRTRLRLAVSLMALLGAFAHG